MGFSIAGVLKGFDSNSNAVWEPFLAEAAQLLWNGADGIWRGAGFRVRALQVSMIWVLTLGCFGVCGSKFKVCFRFGARVHALVHDDLMQQASPQGGREPICLLNP